MQLPVGGGVGPPCGVGRMAEAPIEAAEAHKITNRPVSRNKRFIDTKSLSAPFSANWPVLFK